MPVYRTISVVVATALFFSNKKESLGVQGLRTDSIQQHLALSLNQQTVDGGKFASIGGTLKNDQDVEKMEGQTTQSIQEQVNEAKKSGDDQHYSAKDAMKDTINQANDMQKALAAAGIEVHQHVPESTPALEKTESKEEKKEEKREESNKSEADKGTSGIPKPSQIIAQDSSKQEVSKDGKINVEKLENDAMNAKVDIESFTKDKEKTANMFEPGKSLSLSDVVNVGGNKDKDAASSSNIVTSSLTSDKISNKQIQEAIVAAEKVPGSDLPYTPSLSGSGFRVELNNEDGAGYVGTIYVGSEETPAKVLFDTGSDFLALTSDLCNDPKLGKPEVDEAKFDPASLSYIPSGKDLRKCKSSVYQTKLSQTAQKIKGADDEKLDYGSAKLQGKLYKDKACIDANKTTCTDFEFLALYQAQGMDDTDGILGLAVHPDAKKRELNYVWMLKNKGIIDKALVSFSVAGPDSEDQSYAIFGGLNQDQIVGGIGGLKKMQTMAYRPEWTESVKQWSLEGQSLLYGDEECQKLGQEKKFPAIIDTGSSNVGIPEKMFNFLKDKWYKTVHDLDCTTDDNFCQVMTPCSEVAKDVQPISLQISGQVFELKPELYLHQAEGKRCQFAVHSNQMKGSSGNLMIVGDLLLRHLYQVYDFENETISLGVNKHSQDKILMYEAGHRPEDAPKIQTTDDIQDPIAKARFSQA